MKQEQGKMTIPSSSRYSNITPSLTVNNAADAILFYKKAFSAREVMRFEGAGGKIGYAELKIGNLKIMIADEYLDMDSISPEVSNRIPINIYLFREDIDAMLQKALDAGAKVIGSQNNKHHGGKTTTLEDPYGYKWCICQERNWQTAQ